jgi:hypothetical protein
VTVAVVVVVVVVVLVVCLNAKISRKVNISSTLASSLIEPSDFVIVAKASSYSFSTAAGSSVSFFLTLMDVL